MTGCEKDEIGSYQAGINDLEHENYVGAVENFELAISEGDNVAEAFRGEGITYYRMGKYPEALQALDKALELTKEDLSLTGDILSYKAVAQYKMEDYQGSIETCDQKMQLQKDKDTYFLRGRSYLYLDEYEKADADFDMVARESVDYEDFIQIYQVYENNGLKADGEAYLERAMKLSGETEEDLYNKGRIYYYLEEYEKAAEELKASYEKGYKEAALYLGKVYVELGKIEEARTEYEKCLEEDDFRAKAYNGLAYCDMMEENYDGALEYIAKGLETQNKEEQRALLFNEIVIYEKKLDFATAKEKTTAYLKMYPTDEAAVKEGYFLETR